MWRSTSTHKTAATSVNLASDLSSSTAAREPIMRLRPSAGLNLENLGATLFHEKWYPPVTPEAKIATTAVTASTGKTSNKASSN